MRRLLALSLCLVACGSSSSRNGFDENDPNGKPADGSNPPAANTGDFGKQPPPPAGPGPEIHEVFGHSADTLYKLDPDTKAVTIVHAFQSCDPIIDIALDESSTLYGTSYNALYTIDKTTAKCTQIATGTYPNSLSFVPKGTVDANEEALVGFDQGNYVRIDTKTGTKTKIGSIGGGLASSGDIVSVKGGATYVTVKGGTCDDCIIEINPANGSLVKNWGAIAHTDVFGLSFWGGKVYGFDNGGDLFEVTFDTSGIKTTPIAIPSKPAGLSFWGAGSTTSAPLVPTTK
jgi:DNA-binding beta-propeller fold protein YncE